jgi:hypothetical protein
MQDVPRSKGKHPIRAFLFLSQPTILVVGIIFVLVFWHVPTRVRIELVVTQETFAVGMTDTTKILHAIHDRTVFVKKGKISYPEYSEIKAITFTFPDRIEVEELEKFQIEEITIDPERKEIRLCLDGVARHISTGSAEFWQDHRLTQFDRLKNSHWVVLLGAIGWLAATIAGWYRLYKELKG